MPDDFAKLRAKLQSLANEQRIAAERKALRAAGKVIVNAITEICPEQAGEPEGLLAPGVLRESFRAYVRIASDGKSADGEADTVTVLPNTQVCKDVAGWVERGHAGRTPNAKRTRPNPFIRPAQDACAQQAIDTFTSVMTAEIKKAFNE
jgi:HK97 gp10 family phage protein